MADTLSTQKRAHLANPAALAAATSNWSTALPEEVTVKLAERIVDDNDIDTYMAFCAVCHNWRRDTADQPGKVNVDPTDPTRFQPTKWALLDKQDDRVTFVDVDAGRFLRMIIPVLRNYLFVGATSGGLIVLGEKEEPHHTYVLNPFTGAMAHFKVSAPAEGVMAVEVTTKPLMVFVSLEDGDIIWADQSSELFRRFSGLKSGKLTPIASFNGDMYASNPHGEIYMSIVDDVPRSAEIVWMGAIIYSLNNNNADVALARMGSRYYLVQSGEDLLLVTRPLDGVADDQPLVRRVDNQNCVLEPVRSIGSRAIFVSHVRSISVDADKFQGIRGGWIYFVEPILAPQGDYVYAPSRITTYQVADDGPQAGLIMFEEGILEGCSRPFTVTQAFAEYCRTVHYHELHQMISSDWDWDCSDTDSDGSDYEVESWELEEAAEFFGIN